MALLLPYGDVVMGNIWSAHDLPSIPLDLHMIESKKQHISACIRRPLKTQTVCPVKTVAVHSV
jgi:hypothetical protein